jgi:hypothetical protein
VSMPVQSTAVTAQEEELVATATSGVTL